MSPTTAVLFLFASLGVINGLLLGGFLLLKSTKTTADRYFGALLLMLSVRIGKSIVYYFDPTVSKTLLQVGLSACVFIGPLFAFYVRAKLRPEAYAEKQSWRTLGGLLLLVLVIGAWFPYASYPALWNSYVVMIIYIIWLAFFLWGVQQGLPLLGSLLQSKPIDAAQKHLLGVIIGMTFITATYQFAYYVRGITYIWGSLIFTVVFYYLAFREVLLERTSTRSRSKKNHLIHQTDPDALQQLEVLVARQQPYKNPKLQLKDLAAAAGLSTHALSRLLNEVYPHGFSRYINEKRVAEAQRLMEHADHLSLEGIGYEAGFNSKSSFFSTFKKITDQTPAQYKKRQDEQRKTAEIRPAL